MASTLRVKTMNARNISKYIYTAIVLFLIWIVLTSTFAVEEVVAGLVLSAMVAAIGYSTFTDKGMGNFHPKRLGYLILYIPIFFVDIVKANLDVAYRVLHPKMPIKPGIVEIHTDLKSDVAKLGLANSITLTPGTLTMDVDGDRMFIHWIYVRTSDIKKASDEIGGKFERFMKVIFE